MMDGLPAWFDDSESWRLVNEYAASSDFVRERLKARGDIRRLWAIDQAECRRRTSKKLPVYSALERFVFPTMLSAEQCTSEALAAFHATLVEPDGSGLDMTAGLGVDAMALARVSRRIKSFDIDGRVADALRHNASLVGVSNLEVTRGDSADWLASTEECFDWIFVDPARRGEGGRRLYSMSDCSPDVTKLLPLMAAHARSLIIKASPMLDLSNTGHSLPGITDLYVVGTATECKEVVAVVDLSHEDVRQPAVHAVKVAADGFDIRTIESGTQPDLAEMLEEAAWVAEPWPSLMKCNADGWLCRKYGVKQIARSTHRYVSTGRLHDSFPGRVYEIEKISGYGRRDCLEIRKEYPEVNVTARNFPDTPAAVLRRLGVREGGTRRLFAVRDQKGKPKIIVTKC